jgi:neprilysin
LIEQYDEYEEPELSLNIDGKRTLNENIADNAGLKLAYNAYRKWNENFTGKRLSLIGLDYTWDQLFFVSAAQLWCGVYREGNNEKFEI